MRDGVTLRINMFRPQGEGEGGTRVPVIMSAHPYGKDLLPKRDGAGWKPPFQYRIFPQPDPVSFSALTTWEAPDPGYWVPRGYAVINCDLRGSGASEGIGEFLSELEGEDYAELIAWAAAQPWSSGKVGLCGVSYLAISQYFAAAQRPPALAAICPWEGINDLYHDFAFPGGVHEDGFSTLWFHESGKARTRTNLKHEAGNRPDFDGFWQQRVAAIERIETPMLVCASFSDHSLHTRGSFNAFARAASRQKWVYTHRGGKWSSFYGADALDHQQRFFDHFLKGADNGWDAEPPVRLAVHDTGRQPAVVTRERAWPPDDVQWRSLYLDAVSQRLYPTPPHESSTSFRLRGNGLTFDWTVDEDIDIIGPMALHVPVSLADGGDMNMFAGVRKFRRGVEIHFEGSFGFARDIVSKGWQRAAHRELDPKRASLVQPVHLSTRAEPLMPGEIVPLSIELREHATRFRCGDVLRLELRGNWFFARDPLRGQFPGHYVASPRGSCTVHTGGSHIAHLYFAARPSGLP